MKLLRRAKVGNVLKNHATHKSKRQKKVSESQFKIFLDVEKETSSGMRQIALVAFAVITGSMAALLRTPDAMLPVKKCLLVILGSGVFLSLIVFLICMYSYKTSVNVFATRHKFIAKRKISLSMLQTIVYISVISFEACLFIFIFDIFFPIERLHW